MVFKKRWIRLMLPNHSVQRTGVLHDISMTFFAAADLNRWAEF
ncbi:hypothetical protein TUMEXPCC7403_03070 [Tumidithrix helvetica PCC 7403]